MRMTYDTYNFLKGLLDRELEQLHHQYVMALDFIPYENISSKKENGRKSGTEKASDILRIRLTEIFKMKTELYEAARNMYVDHPDEEMRKFWGILV